MAERREAMENERDRAEYAALVEQQRTLVDALTAVRQRMQALTPRATPAYRIALRPDEHGADPMSHETLLDDIVVNDVPMFRAEQMSNAHWWVCCYLDDDTPDRICWSLTAKSRPLRIEWRTTEWPDDATYEHEGGRRG